MLITGLNSVRIIFLELGLLGDMYALNSTNNALERWNNVVDRQRLRNQRRTRCHCQRHLYSGSLASAQTVNDLISKLAHH